MSSENPFTAPTTLTPRDDVYSFISAEHQKGGLKGKTALITGAGRGIGRATAVALGNAGANVVCVARSQTEIAEVVREIESKGAKAIAVAVDVTATNAIQHVLSEAGKRLGTTIIDVLVNSAGMTRFNTFESEDEALNDWWKVLEVNLRAPLAFIRAVLPAMRQQKSGALITLASTSGSLDIPFNSAYATSKAAVIKFNQDLNVELEGSGISCFALHPGSVATGLGQVSGAVNMDAVQKTPKMAALIGKFQSITFQTPELSAHTAVALCEEPDATLLSGKYVDAQQDLEEVLREAKKPKNRINTEKLYHLKLSEL